MPDGIAMHTAVFNFAFARLKTAFSYPLYSSGNEEDSGFMEQQE
jgi:hypothetical protein